MTITDHIEVNRSLPGEHDITRVVLPNGITVLVRPNFQNVSINIAGYLPAGSIFDEDDKLGLADFTASMLMRGTERCGFQEIFDALESVGASFAYSCGTHTTAFGGKALAEDLGLLLEMLSETIRTPVFPDEYVERVRSQLLTGLAMRAQSTNSMASLSFDKIVYAGHPYARPEDGYPETISAITRPDLAAFHKRVFGPAGMVIAIAGAVEAQAAVAAVSSALGNWVNPAQAAPPGLPALPVLTKTRREKVTLADKSQTSIILGVAGPPRKDAGFMAAFLGNNIFGQFGMYGRLGDVIREDAGLVYYVYSALDGGVGPGPWYISAGAAPKNVEQVIDLAGKELARFLREPVTAEELTDTKTHFIGALPLSLETNEGVTAALLNIEKHQLGLDYYQSYASLVRAVTAEDILAVAGRFLDPQRLGIGIAGA